MGAPEWPEAGLDPLTEATSDRRPGAQALITAAAALLGGALIALAGSTAVGAAERPDDFGRWQHNTRSCERNLAGSKPAPCSALRFDQNQVGLLNIRFVGPGSGEEASDLLSFVGVVREGSAGLRCQGGRCRLVGPLRTEVTSVSETGFDRRGLPTSLPRAWPTEGVCEVKQTEVRCEAKALSGESWTASAQL